jgi:hypothetical protein
MPDIWYTCPATQLGTKVSILRVENNVLCVSSRDVSPLSFILYEHVIVDLENAKLLQS